MEVRDTETQLGQRIEVHAERVRLGRLRLEIEIAARKSDALRDCATLGRVRVVLHVQRRGVAVDLREGGRAERFAVRAAEQQRFDRRPVQAELGIHRVAVGKIAVIVVAHREIDAEFAQAGDRIAIAEHGHEQLRVRGLDLAPHARGDRVNAIGPGPGNQAGLARQRLTLDTHCNTQIAARKRRDRAVGLEFPALEVCVAGRDEQLSGEVFESRGRLWLRGERIERRRRIRARERRVQRRVVDAVLRGAEFGVVTVAVLRFELPLAAEFEARSKRALIGLGESEGVVRRQLFAERIVDGFRRHGTADRPREERIDVANGERGVLIAHFVEEFASRPERISEQRDSFAQLLIERERRGLAILLGQQVLVLRVIAAIRRVRQELIRGCRRHAAVRDGVTHSADHDVAGVALRGAEIASAAGSQIAAEEIAILTLEMAVEGALDRQGRVTAVPAEAADRTDLPFVVTVGAPAARAHLERPRNRDAG